MSSQSEIHDQACCREFPTCDELAFLAQHGGGLDWLADEPDIYTDDDLEERFEEAGAPVPAAVPFESQVDQ